MLDSVKNFAVRVAFLLLCTLVAAFLWILVVWAISYVRSPDPLGMLIWIVWVVPATLALPFIACLFPGMFRRHRARCNVKVYSSAFAASVAVVLVVESFIGFDITMIWRNDPASYYTF